VQRNKKDLMSELVNAQYSKEKLQYILCCCWSYHHTDRKKSNGVKPVNFDAYCKGLMDAKKSVLINPVFCMSRQCIVRVSGICCAKQLRKTIFTAQCD